ncbi:preprotein translocase subunit SecE [uncultured Actinomyces sp.]|uniref:preprotein translocase subunit SecE n=1 Tax=uncultured Actinomyces sp. TaxID=249061 RepID=UPI00261C8FC1|nr:preprotein translocase subunit SecE [uncultured Actinomyces sp.]
MSETVTAPAGKKRNVFARIARFFREVVDELRKVVWPTWNELTTYFVVVIVFIAAIMVFTGVLDMIFDRIVMWGLA